MMPMLPDNPMAPGFAVVGVILIITGILGGIWFIFDYLCGELNDR